MSAVTMTGMNNTWAKQLDIVHRLQENRSNLMRAAGSVPNGSQHTIQTLLHCRRVFCILSKIDSGLDVVAMFVGEGFLTPN